MFRKIQRPSYSILPLVKFLCGNAQWCFVTLLLFSQAVEVENRTASEKENELANTIESVCTIAYPSTNRVLGYSYTKYKNEFVSEVCVEDAMNNRPQGSDCKHSMEFKPFEDKLTNKFSEARDKITQSFNAYKISLFTRVGETIRQTPGLTLDNIPEQLYTYLSLLRNLQTAEQNAVIIQKLHAGNCGEHASHSAFKILSTAFRFGLNIKLQLLTYFEKNDNHRVVLIGSNLKPGNYSNTPSNPSATENFLTQLKEQPGYLCDSWNGGYLETLSKIKNPLYLSAEKSVIVEDFSLDISTQNLPKAYAKFINDELTKLGLKNMKGTPTFFYKRKDKAKIEIENNDHQFHRNEL